MSDAAADTSKPDPDHTHKAGDTTSEQKLSYFSLYKYADSFDYLLLIGGSLGALVNGASWPVFAIVFGEFMDTFGEKSSKSKFKDEVATLALYFLYIAIATFVSSYVESCLWMWSGNRQTNRIRELYLKAVLRQDVAFFDTHSTTGGLLTGLSEDSVIIQQAISEKVGAFLHHMTTFIAGFAVAFWRGWDMALVMVGCLPFLGLAGGLLVKLTTTVTKQVQDSYAQANQVAQQSISQIRTVAANGREDETINEYDATLDTPFKVGIKLGWYNGIAIGSFHLCIFGTYAAALYYGSFRVANNVLGGYYTGGDVMNVVVAALLGGFAIGQGAPNLAYFGKGVTAARRVFGVIDRKPDIDIEEDGQILDKVEGRIELRNVSFAYPARLDVPIFRDFSLVVPGGQTVALVGSSGSGKSTVVQLVERFYDPIQGQVLLDGVDLRKLQLRWLRSQVGLVSQEPTLFATTILENIAMGRPGASLEEVQQAAIAANAHKFISNLPLKYETHAGERGLQLSGGQKQRIAIARAILKNPKVLLLDEATSALDTESERLVQDALDRMVVGRTTVVVAHRLSTVQGADSIAVVREGAIVEQGRHQELLQNPTGVYTTLVQIQMQAAKQEAGGPSPAVTPVPTPTASRQDLTALDSPTVVATTSAKATASAISTTAAGKAETDGLELVVVQPGKTAPGAASAAAVQDPKEKKVSCWGMKKKASNGDEDEGKKDEKEPKEAVVKVPFSRLMAYNKTEWPYAVVGCIGSGMAGAVQPVFSFILVSVIVALYGDKSKVMDKVSFYCWMFLVVAVGAMVGTVLQQYCFGVLAQNLMRRIRKLLLRNILYQEISFFDQQSNSSAVLIKKLSEDTSYIRGAVGDSLGVISQNILCLAIGYLIAFYYNWRMTLVVTGVLPMLISAMIIYNNYVMGNQSGSDKLYDTANQTVTDAFTSIRAIHAYNLQEPICSLYHRLMAPADKKTRYNAQLTGASMGYSQFMVFALYALVIWFAGLEVSSGRSDFDSVLKAFVAVLMAAMGIAQAQVGFPDLAKAQGSVQKVFPLLDRKSAIDASTEEGLVLTKVQGTIELRDVTFVYPTRAEVTVFKHFSLLIPAGQTVALVGESGSGKSTVVSLIERFYDPVQGIVLLDGEDLRLYQLKWLRAQIALVSQEPLLFSRSILENIRYGRPEATLEEVQSAARTANAHDFISALPEGYNTQVGEQGVQLSGGQKQRVAIARAVIKDPRILLLDEATSALDATSERVVQQALDGIMVGRTSVVVAHRLSTIRNANSIAFVHRGTILEQGTHDELMARPDGGYAKLVAAQMAPRGGAASASASRADLTVERASE